MSIEVRVLGEVTMRLADELDDGPLLARGILVGIRETSAGVFRTDTRLLRQIQRARELLDESGDEETTVRLRILEVLEVLETVSTGMELYGRIELPNDVVDQARALEDPDLLVTALTAGFQAINHPRPHEQRRSMVKELTASGLAADPRAVLTAAHMCLIHAIQSG